MKLRSISVAEDITIQGSKEGWDLWSASLPISWNGMSWAIVVGKNL